jgi:hypothetical protein
MKYKRFKRWVFTVKLRIPPKADKDQVEEQVTPHAAAIKMLETPITHKSPSLTCFIAMRADSFQNPVRSVCAPHPLLVHGGVPCHPTNASSILPSTSRSPTRTSPYLTNIGNGAPCRRAHPRRPVFSNVRATRTTAWRPWKQRHKRRRTLKASFPLVPPP